MIFENKNNSIHYIIQYVRRIVRIITLHLYKLISI